MEESYFDGGILQLVGYSILAALLTAITFGIGYPWALCMLQRWETKHTVVESKRLNFDGTGLQLLGMWIMLALIPLVVLLAVMTVLVPFARSGKGSIVMGLLILALFGAAFFYAFYVQIQIKKWTIKHTSFVDHVFLNQVAPESQIVSGYGPERIPSRPVLYQAKEKDWVEKIAPALPLVYVVWFCGISVGTFFLLYLIFA